jgi:hypothetical protein
MTVCARTESVEADLLALASSGEIDHLRTCPACRAATERVRRFDTALGAASRALIQEALPPARLLIAPPAGSGADGLPFPWRATRGATLRTAAALGATLGAFVLLLVIGGVVVPRVPSSFIGAGDSRCDAAFQAWTIAWTEAGGPEREGGHPPDPTPADPQIAEEQLRLWLAYERRAHDLTVATFGACSRDALRSANERLPVSRSSSTGQVAQPFIVRFDESVTSWCEEDRTLSPLSACR